MPTYPAIPDKTAPITKPAATASPKVNPKMIVTTNPTAAIVIYCLFKYAAAPSCIALAISCIFSLPASAAIILLEAIMP